MLSLWTSTGWCRKRALDIECHVGILWSDNWLFNDNRFDGISQRDVGRLSALLGLSRFQIGTRSLRASFYVTKDDFNCFRYEAHIFKRKSNKLVCWFERQDCKQLTRILDVPKKNELTSIWQTKSWFDRGKSKFKSINSQSRLVEIGGIEFDSILKL